MRTQKRYMPVMMHGTSAHDHLVYEVEERISAAGYASKRDAMAAWIRASKAADACRVSQGYSRVDRPRCAIREISATHDFRVDSDRTVSERWEAESYAAHGHVVVERVCVEGTTYEIPLRMRNHGLWRRCEPQRLLSPTAARNS